MQGISYFPITAIEMLSMKIQNIITSHTAIESLLYIKDMGCISEKNAFYVAALCQEDMQNLKCELATVEESNPRIFNKKYIYVIRMLNF